MIKLLLKSFLVVCLIGLLGAHQSHSKVANYQVLAKKPPASNFILSLLNQQIENNEPTSGEVTKKVAKRCKKKNTHNAD